LLIQPITSNREQIRLATVDAVESAGSDANGLELSTPFRIETRTEVD
jgi:hypothetical protein